jgi:hypothetical protein
VCFQDHGVVYMIGSGDCGQLGLGESVSEKLRPGILELPGNHKVCTYPKFAPRFKRPESTAVVFDTSALTTVYGAGTTLDCRWHAHSVPSHRE